MAAVPSFCPASETRLNAAGGLESVFMDESSDLNLFLNGNPAGLGYLNSRSRLDLSARWLDSDQEGPWGSARLHAWDALAQPEDHPGYGGAILFPSPHWAFQAAGGFSQTGGTETPSLNQYQGMVRICYALSFGSVGVELLDSQKDLTLISNPWVPASEFLEGERTQNQTLVKTGIAVVFPGVTSPGEPRWQAGAYLALPAGSQSGRQSFSISENSLAPILVSQTTTADLYHASGLEMIYEVPASLKVELSASLLDESSKFEQTTSASTTLFENPSLGRLNFQSGNMEGSFRYSLPLDEDQNLKCGGSLGFHWDDNFANYGFSSNSFQQQQLNLLLGLGFEEVKEYTMGLQWKSRRTLAANGDTPPANQAAPTTADFVQLAFGGERWLSPVWALRLGLVLEQDDAFRGGSPTLTTTLHGGAGWEQVLGRLDFGLSLGQSLDTGNSSNTIGFFGAELSATLFL